MNNYFDLMERNSRDSSIDYLTNDTGFTNFTNFSSIHICFPALNQFYYVDSKHLEYNTHYQSFFSAFEGKKDILGDNVSEAEFFPEEVNDSKETSPNNKTPLNLENNLDEIFEMFKDQLDAIAYVNRVQVELLASCGYEFIFICENSSHLLMDRIIVEYFARRKILFDFKRRFLTKTSLIEEIKQNKSKDYIVLDYSMDNLRLFEGCWKILLTPYVFSHLDKNPNSDIHQLINKNISLISENKADNLNTISFSSNNFYQLAYYYNEIERINLITESDEAEIEELEKLLKKLNPVVVCLLVRTLRRRQEFKKQRFYISNDKVLYTSHIGGDNLVFSHLFKKSDALLSKAVECKDLELYAKMFQNVTKECEENIWMANCIPTLKHFVEKDLMGEYLTNFTRDQEVGEVTKQFGYKLLYPQSITLNILDVLEGDFTSILKSKQINFPLIIKYKGKANYFKHLITFVFDENSLDNYINYLKGIEEEEKEKTNLVIQRFINHGGKVLKFYHINKENYLDYRSSLPDIDKEFHKNFEQGFWSFKTIELERGKYYQMLMQYNSHSAVESLINEEKMNFMQKIVYLFEKYSKFTLFGLDFLYSQLEETFYIIDCNSLPGYKIRKNINLPEKFRSHFLGYKP